MGTIRFIKEKVQCCIAAVICCVRDGWKRFWWYYNNDPVKKCNLHINEGCSHVDGLLCNYLYCDMMQEYNREHGR